MAVWYMSERSKEGNHAGKKARNDIETIFECMKFRKIGNKLTRIEKHPFLFRLINILPALQVKTKLARLKNETIIFQYPITAGRVFEETLIRISKRNKLIFIIHDVNSIRFNRTEKEKEIKFLNCAEAIICHNERMIEALRTAGVTVKKIVSLELFDYVMPQGMPIPMHNIGNEIAYAGNLEKGGFLEHLATDKIPFDFHLNLFGINYEELNHVNIKYHGVYNAEELVNQLEFSYGLVWDSLTPDTCTGALGEYTKINNPHKCSLYIAAGLPLIVWEQSAIAELVKRYNIGITISSLYEIDSKIKNITIEQYSSFLKNLEPLTQRVREGAFTMAAINKAIY